MKNSVENIIFGENSMCLIWKKKKLSLTFIKLSNRMAKGKKNCCTSSRKTILLVVLIFHDKNPHVQYDFSDFFSNQIFRYNSSVFKYLSSLTSCKFKPTIILILFVNRNKYFRLPNAIFPISWHSKKGNQIFHLVLKHSHFHSVINEWT